jgi:hypothetical protein
VAEDAASEPQPPPSSETLVEEGDSQATDATMTEHPEEETQPLSDALGASSQIEETQQEDSQMESQEEEMQPTDDQVDTQVRGIIYSDYSCSHARLPT